MNKITYYKQTNAWTSINAREKKETPYCYLLVLSFTHDTIGNRLSAWAPPKKKIAYMIYRYE